MCVCDSLTHHSSLGFNQFVRCGMNESGAFFITIDFNSSHMPAISSPSPLIACRDARTDGLDGRIIAISELNT